MEIFPGAEGLGEAIDETAADQGFIALDVDYVGEAGMAPGDFGNSVRAAGVGVFGEFGFGAEGAGSFEDAFIVGGNNDMIEAGAGKAAFPDVLDEWFAIDDVEGFSWEA